jgi:hypothetical protein
VGAIGKPLIFVNDSFSVELHNSNYRQIDMPQGGADITATVPLAIGTPTFTKYVIDPADARCGELNWRHLTTEPQQHLDSCNAVLTQVRPALKEIKSDEDALREIQHPDPRLSVCGNHDNIRDSIQWGPVHAAQASYEPVMANEGKVLDMLRLWLFNCEVTETISSDYVLQATRFPQYFHHDVLHLSLEAGKSYYIRWSVTSSGGALRLVDEATGQKDIRKLEPASE